MVILTRGRQEQDNYQCWIDVADDDFALTRTCLKISPTIATIKIPITTTVASARVSYPPKLNNRVVAASGGWEAFSANAVTIARATASTEVSSSSPTITAKSHRLEPAIGRQVLLALRVNQP